MLSDNSKAHGAERAKDLVKRAVSLSREKDSRQMAVGSKCGTTDYRTKKKEKISRAKAQREPSSEKILNRRFPPINADQCEARIEHSAWRKAIRPEG